MIKLKPCPFCGANEQFLYTRGVWRSDRVIGFIKCGVCGAQTKAMQVLDETPRKEGWNYDDPAVIALIAAWNTRAEQSANEENHERERTKDEAC